MDRFEPQAGPMHLKEGHEETDLSVRGIVLFGIALALSGAAAFLLVLGFYWGLQRWEQNNQAKLTPVEEQLRQERETPAASKTGPPNPGQEAQGVKPAPDFYGRVRMEEHLQRTFPGPRLQYDDVYDMTLFRTSEEHWLASTGKNPDGGIHIPVNQAMDLLVQRGLPQVSGPFVPPMLPTAVPLVPAGPSRR
jgi:hypothetical protein